MVESFASATDLAPAVGCNGVNEFVLDGDGTEKPYIAYVEAQYNVSPGCRVNICQLGEGMAFEGMRKLWSIPEGGLGEVSDGGTRVHNINILKAANEDDGKQGVYLLTYKCNNGIGLYCIAEAGFNDTYPDAEGVEGIEMDEVIDGEAEYFNLQGVKVANPENGLYIKKAGNKATKVLVK